MSGTNSAIWVFVAPPEMVDLLERLFDEFPVTRLFPLTAVQAMSHGLAHYLHAGYDVADFVDFHSSVGGLIALAGITHGLLQGGMPGCDGGAVEAGEARSRAIGAKRP